VRIDSSASGLPRWRWGDPVEPLRAVLSRGGVLAIPTESSYGLAVDPRSAAGVEAIYRLKGRERGKPLPVVIADRQQLAALPLAPLAEPLRRAMGLWPAPLSLVLPLAAPVPAAAGGTTLAVRVPAHSRLRELLAALGTPLTATSANLGGEPSIVDPDAVALLLAGTDGVLLDDGVLRGGPPSTLAAWESGEWRIVRPGPVSLAALATLSPRNPPT
jgi:L-threonylcarbamoyladenylate synthase